ncbi:DUF3530 family protein [Rheinheimera sp. NSM]|uniref:DUF3530 family protein n=1 Tax=Rheinheimera sp. NSM TaxID=3457884 RepID=UPI0040371D7A
MRHLFYLCLLFHSLLLASFHSTAVSLSAEQAFVADLTRQITADELVELPLQQQSFLLLRREAMTSYTKGTAILLPDGSEHAASPKHIDTLRQQLNDYGWHTLALMPPTMPADIVADDVLADYQQQLVARLNAAQQLAQQTPGVTIIIAQGSSAALLNQLYASQQLTEPAAFIMLGAYLTDTALNRQIAKALATHQVPTLDISHQQDNNQVLSQLRLRRQLVNKHMKPVYRQRHLSGSGYNSDVQQWVVQEIYGWLTSVGL